MSESEDKKLLDLFRAVAGGQIEPAAALGQWHEDLNRSHTEIPLSACQPDLSRSARNGFPEVVFGEGKRLDDLLGILAELELTDHRLLVTRVDEDHVEVVGQRFPDLEWHERARVFCRGRSPDPALGLISVLAAGTTDIPVAEEAALTAEMMGLAVDRHYDIGVAGLHRLMSRLNKLRMADLQIVCAGMEGALPSVLAGLVAGPVIAVPTAVGYGASFGGLAALLGMLNSCAPGVLVVNIGNGFGAGFAAGRWLKNR